MWIPSNKISASQANLLSTLATYMWTSKTKGPPLVSHESILFLSDLCSVSLSPLLSLESNEAFRSSRLLSPAQFAGGRRCRRCSSSLTSFLCAQASLALAWSLRGKGRPALQASLRHQPCPPGLPARRRPHAPRFPPAAAERVGENHGREHEGTRAGLGFFLGAFWSSRKKNRQGLLGVSLQWLADGTVMSNRV